MFSKGGTELLRVVIGLRLIPLKVFIIIIYIYFFTIIIATIFKGVNALISSVINKEY